MKKIKWIALSGSIPLLIIIFLCIGIFVALIGGAGDAASSENCDDSSSSSITDQNVNKEAFEKVVKEKCGAFSDKAEKIEEESEKAGVSPLLMAAIMASESGWGSSAAIKNDNNPSGQMNAGGIIHYNSLDEGIEATGKTLHNLVIEQKLDTIEKLGDHYAPVGASNDPNNLNANWVPSVTKMMKTFNGGKDAGESIATGSDGCSANDITVVGDEVSYFKDVFKIAKNNLGKPYVFGAGGPDSFDCSGFIRYCLSQAGVKFNFGRTAQDIYDGTTRIDESEAKAGDLIFFQGTYNAGTQITHVAFYMGDGKFIGAQGKDVNVSNYKSGYWKSHFVGFGRIK